MKNKNKAAKAAIIGGAAALVSCLALSGCGKEVKFSKVEEETIQEFGVGEHNISVPIPSNVDVRKCNVQYEYIEGYEPVGISLTAFGRILDFYNGGAILYTNVEDVECTSNYVDANGNYLFLDFGVSHDYTPDTNVDIADMKLFEEGQHIISTPLVYRNNKNNFQYEYHEGYEIVGIATTASGELWGHSYGGAVLYKNIVPVLCTKDEKGFTTFGEPLEKDMQLHLKY